MVGPILSPLLFLLCSTQFMLFQVLLMDHALALSRHPQDRSYGRRNPCRSCGATGAGCMHCDAAVDGIFRNAGKSRILNHRISHISSSYCHHFTFPHLTTNHQVAERVETLNRRLHLVEERVAAASIGATLGTDALRLMSETCAEHESVRCIVLC